jgi:hypothetical protein
MFTQDLLDHIGICNALSHARLLAHQFDEEKLFSAGGKVENTIERAYVRPIGHRGSINGWIVLIEKREISCVGRPWEERVRA